MVTDDSSHINAGQRTNPIVGGAVSSVRVATPSDIDGIINIFTSAFFEDPLWGPVFPDVTRRAGQANAFWRQFVTSALRYPWTFVTEQGESAATWLPPGSDEFTAEDEDAFESFLVAIADQQIADNILAILKLFEESRPSEPHYYLSLLGTHENERGHGSGMALLRENLARIDILGKPAYLESTNPRNNKRYMSVGFRPHGSFTIPSGHIVTTMWRPAAS
jgi:GNAT superfamily N-acetyltransferase